MTLIERIARVCHQANKAFCETVGDYSQVDWEDAEEWQRESARNCVRVTILNPSEGPEDQHEVWVSDKMRAGWKYGPVKDAEKKEHPCMVPYADLPTEQKVKDALFRNIVNALLLES